MSFQQLIPRGPVGGVNRQQLIFSLGVIGHMRLDDPRLVGIQSGQIFARDAFARLVDAAVNRGLDRKVRRQLVGATRRGRPTTFALGLVDMVHDKLLPSEIDSELLRLSRVIDYFCQNVGTT